MTRIVVLALAALSANAQSLSFPIPLKAVAHPIATMKSTPKDVWFRRASVGLLEAVNFGDYETTKRGVIDGPYCEQNKLFLLAPCVLNKPRFVGVKIAVAAFGVAQEMPEFFPRFRAWSGRPIYEQVMGIVNIGVSVPLGIAVIGNIKTLNAGH